jgi:nicotinate-nucleotide pyrophosphorylase (carboxylating)
MKIPFDEIKKTVEAALAEDIGPGDITTRILISKNSTSKAQIIAKNKGVIAGLPAAEEVFRTLDKNTIFISKVKDGDYVESLQEIAEVEGLTGVILSGERIALNFLGRLSAIASAAYEFSVIERKYNVKIMDTRKTTPGLRALEKYAVAAGGGFNHRMGLYDAVLIKDNHIQAAGGSISEMIKLAREKTPAGFKVEVEAADLNELMDALEGRPDIILLDNMTPGEVKEAVKIARAHNPGVLLEVSGNITPANLKDYASAGPDMISVGALTHSVKNFDLSMRMGRKK